MTNLLIFLELLLFRDDSNSKPRRHRRVESDSKSKMVNEANALVAIYSCEEVPCNGKVLNFKEFVLKYKKTIDNRYKSFTLSLSENVPNNEEQRQLGNERTFQLGQFDSSIIYDQSIEFKKNHKEATEAVLKVKIQYIRSYSELLFKTIENLSKARKRIHIILRTLHDNIQSAINSDKEQPENNGGWYSMPQMNIRKSNTFGFHRNHASRSVISEESETSYHGTSYKHKYDKGAFAPELTNSLLTPKKSKGKLMKLDKREWLTKTMFVDYPYKSNEKSEGSVTENHDNRDLAAMKELLIS